MCPPEGTSVLFVHAHVFLVTVLSLSPLDASNLAEYTDVDADSKLRKGHIARQKVTFLHYICHVSEQYYFIEVVNIISTVATLTSQQREKISILQFH